jgi:hypothetical protein
MLSSIKEGWPNGWPFLLGVYKRYTNIPKN